jgi:hypothetical protein
LVDVQLSVDDPPWTIALGDAVSVSVGAGVGGVTETVASFDAEPPAPVHVSVNVVVCASADVTCVPDVALVPDQPPDARQFVALLELQVSVEVPPCATWAGFADSETVGTGGDALTATVAVCVVEPPGPVQASV